jgi:hypothetical protein
MPEAILEITGEAGGREEKQEGKHGNYAEQRCCPQKDLNGGGFQQADVVCV